MKHTPQEKRIARVRRIRAKIRGTSDRPRLSVNRTLGHMYVQLIDDEQGRTLLAVHSTTVSLEMQEGKTRKVSIAYLCGKKIAEIAREKGIQTVVFDRGGYPYHGRIRAVAEGARAGGLAF